MRGWHELSGDMGAGKTTLAVLAAREYERVLWISAPQEYSPTIFEALDYEPYALWSVGLVRIAFEAVYQAQGDVDLVVIDSLAGLGPTHSQARTIAADVRRAWFEPDIPILVVNQDRYPAPPGGTWWRSCLAGSQTLVKYRDRPFLMSQLVPDGRWFIWKDKPELRGLSREEEELWFPKEGEFYVAGSPIGISDPGRPWPFCHVG